MAATNIGKTGMVWAVGAGGLIAGVLDITFAIVTGLLSGRPAVRTLQSVASGWQGRAAFQGGWTSAALGLLLHFFIAGCAAAAYSVARRMLAVLVDRPWIYGMLFGVLWYLVMYRVVLPLSAVPFTAKLDVPGLLAHMFLVGVPIALCARLYSQ